VRAGAARQLFRCVAPEVILAGPAGTGKSRACLERLHKLALDYPGMRGLMVRRTRKALTQSAMVTFREKVLHPLDNVVFRATDQEYRYGNGSVIVVAGLDDPAKVMSAEYDLIYVMEATEVTEHAWETLTARLRNGVVPFQQIIGDCNPDAPTHWLKRRADRGATVMLESRHEDNPSVTAQYLAVLDSLTGVRYLRLRKGIWAAAEGLVYDDWNTAVHLTDRFDIPPSWRKLRVIDFGYTNPFVCQWWALDGDSRMYLYRELYMTQRTVDEHATQILALSKGETYIATVADHDAEDRATLAKRGIVTIPAYKAVSRGIQAVQGRLRPAGDGRPRLFFLRDSLIERDERLSEMKKPCCTAEEFDGYVWPKGQDGRALKEEPVKEDDHGMDACRYAVASRDLIPRTNAPAIAGSRPAIVIR